MKPVSKGVGRTLCLAILCGGVMSPSLLLGAEPKERLKIETHADWILSVAISPDGKTLASGSYDRTIKLWDVATGKCTITIKDPKGSTSRLAFSPDGKTIASAGGKIIKLWDVATGKSVDTLEGHTNTVICVTFSPNGKMLASSGMDKTIKFWDLRTGLNTATLTGHGGTVSCVAFSPDGKTLASGSVKYDKPTNTFSGEVKLWDVATGKNTANFEGHSMLVKGVAFSPDGKTLATASGDRSVKLWDVASGKNTATLTAEQITDLTCVALNPDGTTVVAAGSLDGQVDWWSVDTGKHLDSRRLHSYQVNSLAFSPDGKMLATASGDKTIKLWDWPLPPK